MSDYPDMLHPEVEAASADDLRTLQESRWADQVAYLAANSEFFKRKLGKALSPDLTLDGLQDLELTDKEELRASQEVVYPFGDYAACHPDKVVRVHRTSGTTGRALILANSQRDVEVIAQQGGRGFWASGLRPSDRVVHCLNYQMWTGGVTDHMALEATGATVLPYGVGGTKQLLDVIRDMNITAISSTPSYPSVLEKALRETSGLSPKELGLRIALFGGEAGLDNVDFRRNMEDIWGFSVRNANFGLSEVMSNMGAQCQHGTDLHFHSGDVVFFELLDVKTGQRLKPEAGVSGELVCTHLYKECQPLIRYRTRDVLTIIDAERCACGRTTPRFRVSGRTDDMFNVRGVNIFPSAIQHVVTASPDLSSGHFRIVLEGPGPYDRVKLRVEAPEHLGETDWDGVANELSKRIQEQVGASAVVDMIAFDSLPRSEGKTSLLERV